MGKYLKIILGFALLLGGLVFCGAGLWVLFIPSYYAAMARIVVQPDAGVPSPQNSNPVAYDPYIVKTTFGIILSPLVLSNVVAPLNLNDEWGKKYAGGKKLTTSETIELLKRHINLAPIHNTKLIEIWAYCDDPDEAAKIANQIAKSYHMYRLELTRQKEPASTNDLSVQIVDLAVPPQTLNPSNGVRVVGAFLFVVGLIPIFAGFRFLKSSCRQSV
jgi:capsular polysaccharide biosynthesis protein